MSIYQSKTTGRAYLALEERGDLLFVQDLNASLDYPAYEQVSSDQLTFITEI